MAEREYMTFGTIEAQNILSPDIGATTQGQKFYLDPANGSDGHRGLTPGTAFKTITKAYAACTANQNDIVYYLSGSSSITLTDTLTWGKDYTHLIGICAPTRIGQRARFFLTALGTANPMIDVTANSCIMQNLYFFHGVASTSSLICTRVTGQRNYFENVHFAGIGHATGQGDVAAARSLSLAGGDENTFKNCTIGVDTTARSVANAEIDCTSQATRNYFENCKILSFADANTHLFLKIDTAGMDRFIWFKDCMFFNAIGSTATTMAEAFDIGASSGGLVILENTSLVGATTFEAATVSGQVYITQAAPTAASSGEAVAVAAS